MWSWLSKIASACLGPVRRYARTRKDEDGGDNGRVVDDLLWSRDLGRHAAGEFSFAVAQANEVLEDHSQVETGGAATFVGVYDGHGGAEAARFISEHLFAHLVRLAQENGTISEDVVRSAFSATEEGFLTLVRRTHFIKPMIAAVGSCCLVGVIWRGTLYVANLGDSRAVVGSLGRSNKIVAEPLTRDHNACMEEVRQELISRHPDDSEIVVLKHGVLAHQGHNSDTMAHVDLQCMIRSTLIWKLLDLFLPILMRLGVAKRLVRAALKQSARKREMRYDDLKKVEKGVRRFFHDDITVVVVYIDHELVQGRDTKAPELSVRGFVDSVGTSRFSGLSALS
ncbi:hypothetical protein PR202_gb09394 [Eleusine coracana subsp. coracana]|uniref:protein-serine/threonine phosphatase n=1 Tax=Eleusine coracana subsp. coracana TaxID=191504 RepID=A0AAV5EGL4_ELECO|nr:hypothetical protein PR202_gb09394 [Eleusine coracana subsp. coracana]